MDKLIAQRVAHRYVAAQRLAASESHQKQTVSKVLQKVENFLGAFKKATDKYRAAVRKADSPEPGYVQGAQMRDFWGPLKKFTLVARNLGQDDLEDLYYDTEDSLNERARHTLDNLKVKMMEIATDRTKPSLGNAWLGAKSVSGDILMSVESMDDWFKATQTWLADTSKALSNAKKETNKTRNWKTT